MDKKKLLEALRQQYELTKKVAIAIKENKFDDVREEWNSVMSATELILKTTTAYKFDINAPDFYEHGKLEDRTRKRLTEIAECGMEEFGNAQFGFKGVMSGLYIEKVWSYSDEAFKDYMGWAKELIAKKKRSLSSKKS